MKNKIAIFTLSLLGLYQPAHAITLIGWDIPVSTQTTTSVSAYSSATGVTAGSISMGSGLLQTTGTASSNSWRAKGYDTTTTDAAAFTAANTAGDYWAFQFGASSGYSVTIDGIGAGTWSISNTGPTKMSMIYSTTSDFASFTTIATATQAVDTTTSFSTAFTTALGAAPITIAEGATAYFRLVGYGASSNGGTGGLAGNLSAPDFSITGTSTSLALLNWTGGAGVWANGVAANWQNGAGASTAWAAGTDGTIGNGGTLAVDAGGVTAGVVTVSGATEATLTGGALSAGSLAMTAGSTLNLNNANSAVSGAIDLTDATLSGGNLAVGSSAVTVSTDSKTISTSLSGATATLTKSGAGELILSGDNTYGGQTAVAAGTLTTGKANILSDTATLKLDNLATLKLGGNETVGALNAAFGSTNNLQSFTLTAGGNNLSFTNGALTTGSGGLVKNGTGQMYMNQILNTYSGGFTLNNGEVLFTSSGAAGAGGVTNSVFGTGTLTWNGGTIASQTNNSGKTVNNNIVLNGTVQSGQTSWGSTSVTMNTNASGAGAVLLTIGTNASSTTSLLGNSTINTLGYTIWEQNISGDYRITKGGTGASSLSNNFLSLRGSNNIAGVTVSSGILGYKNRNALGTGTLILANGVTVGQDGSINNIAAANGDKDADRTVANNISVLGNVQFGLGVSQSLFSGNVDLNGATRTLTLGNTTTFFGSITNGGLEVQRINTDLATNKSLFLYGANTYSGGTTVIGVADRTNNVQLGLGNNSALGTGSLTFSGGGTNTLRGLTLSTGDQNRTITNNIAINSGVTVSVDTITNVVTFDTGAAVTNAVSVNVALNGVISGAGALIKTNVNTLTLGGANTYAGGTTVNQGALVVNGSVGAVTVNATGSLGGSGTVGAVTLTSGSFLKPGNSPGTLTAASSSWAGGSTYNWQIDDATGTAGVDWDLFSVTGVLDMSALSSSSKMNLVLESLSLANYSTSTSSSWVIAQAGSFFGTGFADDTNVTGLFNITSEAFNGGSQPNGGFQVVTGTEGGLRTLNLLAVPEPSTGALLAFGLGGLVLTRLLRRKQS